MPQRCATKGSLLRTQGVYHHGRELERVLSKRHSVELTFWDSPYNATDPVRDDSLYIMLTPHLAKDFPTHYILWVRLLRPGEMCAEQLRP